MTSAESLIGFDDGSVGVVLGVFSVAYSTEPELVAASIDRVLVAGGVFKGTFAPVNFDRKEAYALGDGYGHLAVVVDDVDAEHTRFEREKLSPGPLRDFKHDGKTLARFFFVSDPDGYKIEVIQRGGRFG